MHIHIYSVHEYRMLDNKYSMPAVFRSENFVVTILSREEAGSCEIDRRPAQEGAFFTRRKVFLSENFSKCVVGFRTRQSYLDGDRDMDTEMDTCAGTCTHGRGHRAWT